MTITAGVFHILYFLYEAAVGTIRGLFILPLAAGLHGLFCGLISQLPLLLAGSAHPTLRQWLVANDTWIPVVFKVLVFNWPPFQAYVDHWFSILDPDPAASETRMVFQSICMMNVAAHATAFRLEPVNELDAAWAVGWLRMKGVLATPEEVYVQDPTEPLGFLIGEDDDIAMDPHVSVAISLLGAFSLFVVDANYSLVMAHLAAVSLRWPRQYWDRLVLPPDLFDSRAPDTSRFGRLAVPVLCLIVVFPDEPDRLGYSAVWFLQWLLFAVINDALRYRLIRPGMQSSSNWTDFRRDLWRITGPIWTKLAGRLLPSAATRAQAA